MTTNARLVHGQPAVRVDLIHPLDSSNHSTINNQPFQSIYNACNPSSSRLIAASSKRFLLSDEVGDVLGDVECVMPGDQDAG